MRSMGKTTKMAKNTCSIVILHLFLGALFIFDDDERQIDGHDEEKNWSANERRKKKDIFRSDDER